MTGAHFLTGGLPGRVLRFFVAGLCGFVAQLASLAVLIAAGLHYLVATVVAVELAIVVNFAWHEGWTWRDRPSRGWRERAARLMRYNTLTAVTSIAGSLAVTALLVEWLSLSPVAANAIGVVVLGALNFAGADTLVFKACVAIALLSLTSPAAAAEEAQLQPRTAAGFARYAAAVEARRTRELAGTGPFLAIERHAAAEQARIMTLLRRGEVFVEQGARARDERSNEVEIDGGLINHWRGTVFVPKVTLDTVLQVLQSPDTADHKQEDVLWSRIVPNADGSQKLVARVKRTKFVTVVYDTEYDVRYTRLAPGRATSDSRSTKIVEIENAGTPRERALPEGDDHGYMWRLYSYWRYQQVADGVLVEVESLTLSRDLPPLVGPLIRPIVNSTARESITRTLTSLRARFTAG